MNSAIKYLGLTRFIFRLGNKIPFISNLTELATKHSDKKNVCLGISLSLSLSLSLSPCIYICFSLIRSFNYFFSSNHKIFNLERPGQSLDAGFVLFQRTARPQARDDHSQRLCENLPYRHDFVQYSVSVIRINSCCINIIIDDSTCNNISLGSMLNNDVQKIKND